MDGLLTLNDFICSRNLSVKSKFVNYLIYIYILNSSKSIVEEYVIGYGTKYVYGTK